MLLFAVDSKTSSSPYAVFGDTTTRDFWYRLIRELRAGLQLVIGKEYTVYVLMLHFFPPRWLTLVKLCSLDEIATYFDLILCGVRYQTTQAYRNTCTQITCLLILYNGTCLFIVVAIFCYSEKKCGHHATS